MLFRSVRIAFRSPETDVKPHDLMTDTPSEEDALKALSTFTWRKDGSSFITCVERHPRLLLERLQNSLDKVTQEALDFSLTADGQSLRMRLSAAQYVFGVAELKLNLIEPQKGFAR